MRSIPPTPRDVNRPRTAKDTKTPFETGRQRPQLLAQPGEYFRPRFDTRSAIHEELQRLPLIGRVLVSREGGLRTTAFTLLVFAISVGLIASIPFWLFSQAATSPVQGDSAHQGSAILFKAVEQEKAMAALQRYLSAPHWKDTLSLVRNPNVMSSKMDRWYGHHPTQRDTPVDVLTCSPHVTASSLFLILGVQLLSGEQQQFVLERTRPGDYKIDWEIAVGYQEVDWEAFMAERSQEPSPFRVVLSPGDYYNHAFSNQRQFECWEIRHPLKPELLLYGYAERSGPVAERLRLLHQPKGFNLILSLRYAPQKSDPNQVLISSIVHSSWIQDGSGQSKSWMETEESNASLGSVQTSLEAN